MLLHSEFIHTDPNAPVMVVFGGNAEMRDRVLRMFADFGKVTAYATLGEVEGLQKLRSLQKVDVVLIGGRYNTEQRLRIKHELKQIHPNALVSEPGIEYPYGDEGIKADLTTKLKL